MEKTSNNKDKTKEYASMIDNFIYGNWLTSITYTFAELAIADILYKNPLDIDEISKRTDTNPKLLKRFLRCAANLGFVRTSENKYYIAPMGDLLRTEHPLSRRDAARLNGANYRYQPWGYLVDILRQGNSQSFSPTFEKGSLNYLSDKPELLEVFHNAMTRITEEENLPIVSSYDFSKFKHIVDIGCGLGSFLKTILRENEHIKGTMFDLESTLNMEDNIIEDDLKDRLDKVSGDFFNDTIPNADLYILKNVIHNWNEENALKLLKNIYTSMSSDKNNVADKRLLIIENTIKDNDDYNIANWMDLNFMILVDGAERSVNDYKSFVQEAGFKISNVIPTPTGRDIIELTIA